jgi:hypothetical protein
MDTPYDTGRRLRHAQEAFDATPIGHPMYKHLSAEVDLHERVDALAKLPLDYWTGVNQSSIKSRIDTLVNGDWVALMRAPGNRALIDRVQYETEWLFRCIITSARVRDGDSTPEQFNEILESQTAELDDEEKKREDWGSGYYHTDSSGRHLRTPDDMLRDRSAIRYSSYVHDTQDLLASAAVAGEDLKTHGSDPGLAESIAIDSARFKEHLRVACAKPLKDIRHPHRWHGSPTMEMADAWGALLQNPRNDVCQTRVQLLTDLWLRKYGVSR